MAAKGPTFQATQLQFGAALKEARLKAGMTQAQIAKATGRSEAEISLIERGIRNPTLRTATLLANAAGMSVDVRLRPSLPQKNRPK